MTLRVTWLAVIALTIGGCAPSAPVPSKAQWAKATPAQRDEFIKRIAASPVLKGMTEDQVCDYLGTPDYRADGATYYLDPWGRSSAALIISFSRNGTVEGVRGSSLPDAKRLAWDAELWRSGSLTERAGITLVLANSPQLVGMTREAVYDLLGEPSRTYGVLLSYWSRRVGADGREELHCMDGSYCLSISLTSGVVSKVELDRGS